MSYLDPVVDKIVLARIGLLLKEPFFGNMATRMKLIEDNDLCKTAATDFRNFYYNREFIEKLSAREVEFVVAHEVMHCVFDHLLRKEFRDHQIWNIAADYCVNGFLVREGIGKMPTHIKCFYDAKYDGWNAERVYDEIHSKYDEDELNALGEMLDEHLTGDGDGQPQYSKEELSKIRDEIKEAMIQSAQAAGAGKVPAEINRMIKEWTESKIDWRALLQQQIQSVIKNDYSWTRPSRKGWHTGAILPGTKFDETIDICVAIDMSGSISTNQAKDFLGEIKGIMEEYKEFSIKLWTFDTNVYNPEDFNEYNVDEFTEYKINGGGGTDFMVNWEFMKEEEFVPKKFIMFTDMYPCGSWGDPDYCDTIFVAHGTDSIVAPFGVTAYYSENS